MSALDSLTPPLLPLAAKRLDYLAHRRDNPISTQLVEPRAGSRGARPALRPHSTAPATLTTEQSIPPILRKQEARYNRAPPQQPLCPPHQPIDRPAPAHMPRLAQVNQQHVLGAARVLQRIREV